MKPTLKNYIKGLSIDDLNDLLFLVIDTLNEKKAKQREETEGGREKESL